MNKKAQAQIITVILIILLVLAAIVIVWQVISNTVEQGASQVEATSGCIGLALSIKSVTFTAGTAGGDDDVLKIDIERGTDSITGLDGMRLMVENPTGDIAWNTLNTTIISLPDNFETKSYILDAATLDLSDDPTHDNIALATAGTYTVKIAHRVGGQQCAVIDSKTFIV